MKLSTENKLTELALNFHHKLNSSLKRHKLPMVKMTRIELIEADETTQACIFFNIESWSTHKLLIMEDGRLVRESMDMNSKGISIPKKIKDITEEMEAFQARINLHASLQEDEIAFREYKVKVIGTTRKTFGPEQTFKITQADGTSSTWYGYSAEDALSNGAPWIKGTVTSVELIQSKGA